MYFVKEQGRKFNEDNASDQHQHAKSTLQKEYDITQPGYDPDNLADDPVVLDLSVGRIVGVALRDIPCRCFHYDSVCNAAVGPVGHNITDVIVVLLLNDDDIPDGDRRFHAAADDDGVAIAQYQGYLLMKEYPFGNTD